MADPYQVLLSASVERTLKAIEPKTDRRRIDAVLVFYAGNYGLHHQIDEPRHAAKILFIEDRRRDPLARFSPS